MIERTKTSPEIENLIEQIFACNFSAEKALYRFEVKLAGIDPLVWLSKQNCSEKMYFSSRDNCRWAGIGASRTLADPEITLYDAITQIERDVQLYGGRYFGGISFDPESPVCPEWSDFGKFKFILPRIELYTEGPQSVLAVNLTSEHDGIIDQLCRMDLSTRRAEAKLPQPLSFKEVPAKGQWLESADEIIKSIRMGDLSKLVLARKVLLEMPGEIDAVGVLSALVTGRQVGTYDFCFQSGGGAAFIGSSPERLYSVYGGRIFTEALAGTALVGQSAEESQAYSKELCESEKEQLEQNFVCRDIESALQGLCDEVDTSERTVVKLRTLQHLCTGYNGVLKRGVGNFQIIDALHPTAAVAGLPRELAIGHIGNYEGFSRGFYAGPVGYISSQKAEFAVGIRSALVNGMNVHLFAGAGLMAQSTAEAEWDETQNKLRQYLEIL